MTNENTEAEPAGPLVYERRIVAFLDILGCRVLVSQGYSQAIGAVKAIDDALEHTFRCIGERAVTVGGVWWTSRNAIGRDGKRPG